MGSRRINIMTGRARGRWDVYNEGIGKEGVLLTFARSLLGVGDQMYTCVLNFEIPERYTIVKVFLKIVALV